MESARPNVLRTMGRILTFRADRAEFEQFDYRHLALGLLCTWLVGIGRSWDNPKAELLQHLGVGSVLYVFGLSLLLWVTVQPFAAPDSSYRRVLTFVCLASPPGFLYAIPVEKWMPADAARSINLIFLTIVATWRVALLFFYFRKGEGLRGVEFIVVALLPLSIIMGALAMFHAVVNFLISMGGVRGGQAGLNIAEIIMNILGFVAFYGFFPLIAAHSTLSLKAISRRSNPVKSDDSTRYENPKIGE